MARNAGVVRINFTAGTAEFLADVDKAEAKVKNFKTHGVSDVQAVGAAWRSLKGSITQNDGAVEQFIARFDKLAAVARVAFPVVGAVAFGAAVMETGKELVEFYDNLEKGQERMREAFRGVEQPLRLTNDQLALANARLEADIAKLEGTPRNGLKIALEEARVAADQLADSLDQDLDRLQKFVSDSQVGIFEGLLLNQKSSPGFSAEMEAFQKRINRTTAEGTLAIRSVDPNDQQGLKDARAALANNLKAEFAAMIAGLEARIAAEEKLQAQLAEPRNAAQRAAEAESGSMGLGYSRDLEMLRDARLALQLQQSFVSDTNRGLELKEKKDNLTAAREVSNRTRPFEDRLAALQLQFETAQSRIGAAGGSERYQQVIKAYADAHKAIQEINKSLAQYGQTLTLVQELEVEEAQLKVTQAEAEADWRTRVEQSTTAIRGRVEAQQRLAESIGKGFDATRTANIESRLMQELGSKADDPEWMRTHGSDVERLRQGFSQDFDAQHSIAQRQAVESLNQQIQLERELAAVQFQGAEAVRQATLAAKLRQLTELGATREVIQGEIDLYNARRDNASAANVAEINARAEAVQRLADALMEGAEAERQAALASKYSEMRRQGATDADVAAQRRLDAAEREQQIASAAIQTGRAYRDQLETIDQQIVALDRLREIHGATLEIQIAQRDLENRRIDVMTEQTLRLGGAGDGVHAFFMQMQKDAQTTAQTVYEALTQAHEQGSRELAKLFTGQRPDFGGLFQNIGENMVQSQIKSATQQGLGALGRWAGVDILGLTGAVPDGTAGNPLWVRMADGSGVPGLNLPNIPGADSFMGKLGHGLGVGVRFLLGLVGGGFGGFRANGGFVDPRRAYIVGERGPELFMPQSSGTIIPNGATIGGGGGGGVQNIHIDARGADFGVENRIRRSLQMTHAAAVSDSLGVMREQQSRRPRR